MVDVQTTQKSQFKLRTDKQRLSLLLVNPLLFFDAKKSQTIQIILLFLFPQAFSSPIFFSLLKFCFFKFSLSTQDRFKSNIGGAGRAFEISFCQFKTTHEIKENLTTDESCCARIFISGSNIPSYTISKLTRKICFQCQSIIFKLPPFFLKDLSCGFSFKQLFKVAAPVNKILQLLTKKQLNREISKNVVEITCMTRPKQ